MSDNPLIGKALRYLIGHDGPALGRADEITEVGYDTERPPKLGIGIKYCNLFDEKNSGQCGPYLHGSDTAAQYNEGQIDPDGAGWNKNLAAQFERAKDGGFDFIELDNPDAYQLADVLGAIDQAAAHGLKVIAKNPGLGDCDGSDMTAVVLHPNVYGIIVEKGAGDPAGMDKLRRAAGKPGLPVWFVAFAGGRRWAEQTAAAAPKYLEMRVTYSNAGEYGSSVDVP